MAALLPALPALRRCAMEECAVGAAGGAALGAAVAAARGEGRCALECLLLDGNPALGGGGPLLITSDEEAGAAAVRALRSAGLHPRCYPLATTTHCYYNSLLTPCRPLATLLPPPCNPSLLLRCAPSVARG